MSEIQSETQVEFLLLRVYCVAGDRAGKQYLHEAIVGAARTANLEGATALTGKMGLGSSGRIFSDLLSDTEINQQTTIVEIMDQPERIQKFLPTLHYLVQGHRLITLERVQVLHSQPHAASGE